MQKRGNDALSCCMTAVKGEASQKPKIGNSHVEGYGVIQRQWYTCIYSKQKENIMGEAGFQNRNKGKDKGPKHE